MILLRWLLSAVVIILVAYLVPGVTVANFFTALMVALFLGLVNATVRPILIFITLPFTVVTLGLWLFVINAFLLWFIASWLKGFEINGFLPAFTAAVFISIASWFLNGWLKASSAK